jgi:L-ascorbate metabolism protein UlaG (beta-lactamase superfamily)
MVITKYGHCCLVIEVDGIKILTDPGNHEFAGMGADPARLPRVDAIVITHEHPDHFHLPALKAVLANNRGVPVYTTSAVSGQISGVETRVAILQDGKTVMVRSVPITGIGKLHAEIYGDWNRVSNTGILVANRFLYPGDAFTPPGAPVEILALPIAGPWMKIKEAVDYALALKPEHVFPVHDGMMKTVVPQHRLLESMLPPAGITFHPAEIAKHITF